MRISTNDLQRRRTHSSAIGRPNVRANKKNNNNSGSSSSSSIAIGWLRGLAGVETKAGSADGGGGVVDRKGGGELSVDGIEVVIEEAGEEEGDRREGPKSEVERDGEGGAVGSSRRRRERRRRRGGGGKGMLCYRITAVTDRKEGKEENGIDKAEESNTMEMEKDVERGQT